MRNIGDFVKTWDKEAGSYRYENERQVDYLANYYYLSRCLGPLRGRSVLEVGSGSGQASAYLASKGALVHLVDISERSLQFAKNYFATRKLLVKLYRQNAFSMNFAPESFDYVWNGGVIEHFNDDEKILIIEKMWKLVKPGGKILITVPNVHDFPFIIAKKILQLRGKWAFGKEDDLSITRMKNLANRAGIKRSKVYAFNPIVGFWFFPYGREITDLLHLNTVNKHKVITPFGHVIVLTARKPVR